MIMPGRLKTLDDSNNSFCLQPAQCLAFMVSKQQQSCNVGVPTFYVLHVCVSWLGQDELLGFSMCLLVCQHQTIEQAVLRSPRHAKHVDVQTIMGRMQAAQWHICWNPDLFCVVLVGMLNTLGNPNHSWRLQPAQCSTLIRHSRQNMECWDSPRFVLSHSCVLAGAGRVA